MPKLTIDKLEVKNKRVLIRVDFNVPLNDECTITDDTRITAALPTIKHVLDQGGSVILMSHLGRPKKGPEVKYSLAPVAKHLSRLLDHSVLMLPDCIGAIVEKACATAKPGDIIMLENLRFHPEEEAGDFGFAKQLASLGDLYVNDAFGTAHRAHASTAIIAQFVPKAAAGFLMSREIDYLGRAAGSPERPYIVVLGGAKVSSKLKVIENLLPKADRILIAGGMAYTFLYAKGATIGKSLVENDLLTTAKQIITDDTAGKIILPIDHVCGAEFLANTAPIAVNTESIPDNLMGLDIGPATIALFEKQLENAKMVFWNGPMGVFEFPVFAKGTIAVGKAIAQVPQSIVGGGDTVSAINNLNLGSGYSHISTGGGASLELMEGIVLPGIAALSEA